ncbi:MAG: SPW repeat protein [Caldilineaceae bacterium]|nr:SPW repeat protein [Caldilineaceae bacterium]
MAQNAIQPTPAGGQIRAASGINVVLGLWLIISPWVFSYTADSGALWNSIIVGIIVVILAGTRVANVMQNTWLSWLDLVLGLWIIISPWVYNYTMSTGAMWNSVIVGVLIAALSIWSAMATH